jgi:hypothetical protein
MTDQPKTPEQRAADRLADAIIKYISDGCTGQQIAVAAFATANRSEGSLQGLIRLLCHKGILSRADLGDSIAWALDERAAQLGAQAENGSSILLPPPAPHARGN